MKKTLFTLLGIVIFLCLGFAALVGFNLYSAVRTTFIGKPTVASGETGATSSTLYQRIKRGERVTVLIMGYGGGNHAGTYLTDTIITAVIDGKLKTVTFITIPRDLWVSIPTSGDKTTEWKINAAYAIGGDDKNYPNKQKQFTGVSGGGNLSKYIAGQVLGIPIDYYVSVDFDGFNMFIDSLGGVDVNVTKAFDDYEYPILGKELDTCGKTEEEMKNLVGIPDSTFACRYEHLHFDSGQQHMDGQTALKFVRSRHSLQDGTDFARSRRQLELINAVKAKIVNPVAFINTTLSAGKISEHFKTDLSLQESVEAANHYDDLTGFTFKNIALTNENFLDNFVSSDGQWALKPRVGNQEWSEIHSFISSVLSNNTFYANLTYKVVNGSQNPGLEQTAVSRLTAKGLLYVFPGASQLRSTAVTEVRLKLDDTSVSFVDLLKREFGDAVVIKAAALPKDSEYDVEIVLGADYAQFLKKGSQ